MTGGEVRTNLNIPLHLDKGKQKQNQETHFFTYNFSVSASEFSTALFMCLRKLHVPRFPLSRMLLVFSKGPPHTTMSSHMVICSLQGSCEADTVSLPIASRLEPDNL